MHIWPDLVSSHYAQSVQDYLKTERIPLVLKNINPTNVHNARPIEDFFGSLIALVYEGDWKSNNKEQLKRRIDYFLTNMVGVRARLGLPSEDSSP